MLPPLASQICFARVRIASTAATTVLREVRNAILRRRALKASLGSRPFGAVDCMRLLMSVHKLKPNGMRSGEYRGQFDHLNLGKLFRCYAFGALEAARIVVLGDEVRRLLPAMFFLAP